MKESIRFEGKQNLQTKAMIVLFGLFAEIERDLIVERTKEDLTAAKARGKRLGRPKGARSNSKLDGALHKKSILHKKSVITRPESGHDDKSHPLYIPYIFVELEILTRPTTNPIPRHPPFER